MHEPMFGIALIVVLGVSAQWIAWRIRLPSILLLLAAGLAVGPLSTIFLGNGGKILDPDGLIGREILLPLVSISVGVILYEGGLTLTFREITGVRAVVRNLVSVGAVVAWVGASAGAYFIVGMPADLSILVGAILVVTGPTVVGPLLQHIRPKGKAGPILKWESIVIDPIGATLAVLVFEVIVAAGQEAVALGIATSLAKTVFIGGGLGLACAFLLVQAIKRFWVPDHLQNPVSLLLVVLAIVASDMVQKESGLLAATVMGMVLANQRAVDVRHILEFKENLRVLLISSLFVVLSARLTLGDLQSLDWRAFLFVVVLILVVRPLSVLVSTRGSSLNWNERAFIAWMAPRGIVAAAVASVFALALENTGREDANQIAPVIFSVILGTVAAYGLTATLFARRLGLSDPNPQGLLIVGASPWARAFAQALRKRGIRVVLADSNRENIRAARMEELDTYYGNVLDEYAIEDMDLGGMGRLLAATPNAEVNVLTVHRFLPVFGRAGVYRIPAREPKKSDAAKAAAIGPNTVKPDATGAEPGPADDNTTGPNGRVAFAAHATYANLSQRKGHGHVVKSTTLSDEFTFADYRTLYGSSALMIAVCTPDNLVRLVSPDRPITPEPGDTIIALVDPDALFLA